MRGGRNDTDSPMRSSLSSLRSGQLHIVFLNHSYLLSPSFPCVPLCHILEADEIIRKKRKEKMDV